MTSWQVELNSPNNLKREGWKSTSLKPGDKVTLVRRQRMAVALLGGVLGLGASAPAWDTRGMEEEHSEAG